MNLFTSKTETINRHESKVYLVHDIEAKTFGQPLHFSNNVEAMRELEQIVKDPNTRLSKYASQYDLLEVGTYDSLSGEFNIYNKPNVLTNLSSFLN